MLALPVLVSFALQSDGSSPQSDLGHDLELDLTDVRAVAEPIPENLTEEIGERLDRPGILEHVELFRGRGTIPGSAAPEDLLIARLPLAGPLAGARLVCAVHADGRLAHAALRGRPEFDPDGELAWGLFLGQICSYGSLGPAHELVPDAQRPRTGAELERLQAPDEDGRLLSALARQRVAMRGFTLLQRRLILAPDRIPPAAWLTRARAQFDELQGLSSRFELVLGAPGVGEHRRRAEEAARYLSELEALARASKTDEFRTASGRMRNLCRECHRIPAENGDPWDDAFAELRAELDLPSGLFRVGYDLAPALGDPEGRTSQHVADAVQALLLVASALRAH